MGYTPVRTAQQQHLSGVKSKYPRSPRLRLAGWLAALHCTPVAAFLGRLFQARMRLALYALAVARSGETIGACRKRPRKRGFQRYNRTRLAAKSGKAHRNAPHCIAAEATSAPGNEVANYLALHRVYRVEAAPASHARKSGHQGDG